MPTGRFLSIRSQSNLLSHVICTLASTALEFGETAVGNWKICIVKGLQANLRFQRLWQREAQHSQGKRELKSFILSQPAEDSDGLLPVPFDTILKMEHFLQPIGEELGIAVDEAFEFKRIERGKDLGAKQGVDTGMDRGERRYESHDPQFQNWDTETIDSPRVML
jgi:hypothetical protein